MKIIFVLIFFITTSGLYSQNDTPINPADSSKSLGLGYLSIGKSGNVLGMEIGVKWRNWGIVAGGLLNGEEPPSYNDYSIPHNDYETKKFERSKNYFGILGCINIGDFLSPYAIIGYAFQKTVYVDYSNVSNNKYLNRESTDGELIAGIGIFIFPIKHIGLDIGYNSLIKFKAGIGYSWTL